jgi:hypothetical protein
MYILFQITYPQFDQRRFAVLGNNLRQRLRVFGKDGRGANAVWRKVLSCKKSSDLRLRLRIMVRVGLRHNRFGVIIILVKIDADLPLSQAVCAYLRTLTENTAYLRRC